MRTVAEPRFGVTRLAFELNSRLWLAALKVTPWASVVVLLRYNRSPGTSVRLLPMVTPSSKPYTLTSAVLSPLVRVPPATVPRSEPKPPVPNSPPEPMSSDAWALLRVPTRFTVPPVRPVKVSAKAAVVRDPPMFTTPVALGVMRPVPERVKLLVERFSVPEETLAVPFRVMDPWTLSVPPATSRVPDWSRAVVMPVARLPAVTFISPVLTTVICTTFGTDVGLMARVCPAVSAHSVPLFCRVDV